MRARLAVVAAVACALASAAGAQQGPTPPFLYVSEERILTGSAKGRALLAEEEAARERLRAEARGIETAFEAEERDLTERRAEMDVAGFRALADDFDARVVAARREQDARANALALEFDRRRRAFYAEVGPILVGLMERRGALAVLDETSVVLADPAINVTDAVIAELDRDGDAGEPAPSQEEVGGGSE
jgi:Skp family chaperone for outer membrane proteins